MTPGVAAAGVAVEQELGDFLDAVRRTGVAHGRCRLNFLLTRDAGDGAGAVAAVVATRDCTAAALVPAAGAAAAPLVLLLTPTGSLPPVTTLLSSV